MGIASAKIENAVRQFVIQNSELRIQNSELGSDQLSGDELSPDIYRYQS